MFNIQMAEAFAADGGKFMGYLDNDMQKRWIALGCPEFVPAGKLGGWGKSSTLILEIIE